MCVLIEVAVVLCGVVVSVGWLDTSLDGKTAVYISLYPIRRISFARRPACGHESTPTSNDDCITAPCPHVRRSTLFNPTRPHPSALWTLNSGCYLSSNPRGHSSGSPQLCSQWSCALTARIPLTSREYCSTAQPKGCATGVTLMEPVPVSSCKSGEYAPTVVGQSCCQGHTNAAMTTTSNNAPAPPQSGGGSLKACTHHSLHPLRPLCP